MNFLPFIIAFASLSGVLHAAITPNVPANHPIYDLFDRLEGYGCVEDSFRLTRPQSYEELRQLIFLPAGVTCSAPQYLLQQTRFFARSTLSPALFLGGIVSHDDSRPVPGLEAYVIPSVPLVEGRPVVNGPNLYLEARLDVSGGQTPGFVISVTPSWALGLPDYDAIHGQVFLYEGYVKVGLGQWELTLGKSHLGFGMGKHGTLLLSSAAPALPLLKLTMRPHVLGSPLDFLGPLTLETFVTGTSESTFVSGSRYWGLLLGFRPASWFELGFLELYQFGGEGIDTLSGGDVAKMLVFSSDPNKVNNAYGIHFNTWLTQRIAKLYFQTYFQNLSSFSNWWQQDLSVLLGAYFPRIGLADLRVEYVHTVPGAYKHPIYLQGLTFSRNLLGHPLGSDAEAFYLDLGLPEWQGWEPALGLSYESRLRSLATVQLANEVRYGVGVGMAKRWQNTTLRAALQYAKAKNHRHQLNADSNILSGQTWLTYDLF